MTITKQPVGTRTALTVSGLATLASATYTASAEYDASTQPLDVMIEVSVATTNTPAGNKQVLVFAIASYDGTNYQTGPTSGTTATSEANLTFLGAIALPTGSQTETKSFSLANAYGAMVPRFKVVIKNDLGVALTSGSVYTAEVSSTST